MQTNFTKSQLKEPKIARSNAVLRNCVHCGFCTATCPTYQILGDELDSPRGRIYLIKDMLEKQRKPDEKVVKHVDRHRGRPGEQRGHDGSDRYQRTHGEREPSEHCSKVR